MSLKTPLKERYILLLQIQSIAIGIGIKNMVLLSRSLPERKGILVKYSNVSLLQIRELFPLISNFYFLMTLKKGTGFCLTLQYCILLRFLSLILKMKTMILVRFLYMDDMLLFDL
jgi:hypothetical protein